MATGMGNSWKQFPAPDGDDSSLNGKFRGPGEDLLPEAIPAGNFGFFGS